MNGPITNPKEILRLRARALASTQSKAEEIRGGLDLIEFALAPERYAIESRYVREICPFKELTPLPCTPAFILGIVNIRGRILPVLDLKKLFGLPTKGITDLHRIIVVQGHGLELGLLADVIVALLSIPEGSLQASLPTLTGIRAEYIRGITADRLVVLDLARILTDPAIVVHEEVQS